MRIIEARHYPNFDFVLRKKIPHFCKNPKVMRVFRWWSGLDKKQAKAALLKFDTSPEIQVERINTGHPNRHPDCEKPGDEAGHPNGHAIGTIGWKAGLHSTKKVGDVVRSHISINRGIIWLLEGIPREMLKGRNGRSAQLAKAGRDLANFVASLVMHEIVHFGTRVVGQPEMLEEKGAIVKVDFGSGFQREANLNFRFPQYFLHPHSIKDSPGMMRRGDPPATEFEEVAAPPD